MTTLKDLAKEFGVTTDELRQGSTVGADVPDDAELQPMQEQNLRGVQQQRSAGNPPEAGTGPNA